MRYLVIIFLVLCLLIGCGRRYISPKDVDFIQKCQSQGMAVYLDESSEALECRMVSP